MCIRTLICLLMLCIPSTAYAWDVWAEFIDIICNTKEKIIEPWEGEAKEKGMASKCSPYSQKDSGRKGCLFGHPLPSITRPLIPCIQASNTSTFEDVAVDVLWQTCPLGLWCEVYSDTLRGHGSCLNIFHPLTFLPFTRICIRISVPGGYDGGTLGTFVTADAGYTPGVHLNEKGEREKDKPIMSDPLGEPMHFDPLKMCGYVDPGLISGGSLDVMDWDPTYQPMHKTSEVHPIFKILSSVLQARLDLANVIENMLTGIIKGNSIGDSIADFCDMLLKGLNIAGDIVIGFLNQIGSLNRVVDDIQLGCVNIPDGPFPPPYCQDLSILSTPELEQICAAGQKPTVQAPCVPSDKRNNFVHNSVRVSFNKFIPLCTGANDQSSCVQIYGAAGSIINASMMHVLTGNTDLIAQCKNSGQDKVCFAVNPSNVNIYGKYARIVYTYRMGRDNNALSSYYYYESSESDAKAIKDCNPTTNMQCQAVWGINVGAFTDQSLVFPQMESEVSASATPTPILSKFSLIDYKSDASHITNYLTLQIPRIDNGAQSANSICLYDEDGEQISCVPRAKDFKIAVYQCHNNKLNITCNNKYLAPQFIASIESDADYTATVVKIPSLDLGATIMDKALIRLAGYAFRAFATDNTYIMQPFSNHPHALNPFSIYGRYQGDKVPYDVKTQKSNPDAVYLDGLEYMNGVYVRGAKYACLDALRLVKCSAENTTGCVLSKLKNAELIKCSDFRKLSDKYPGLRLCTQRDKYTREAEISVNGDKKIIINKFTDLSGYCYTSPNNQEICVISYDYIDRIDPSPDLGEVLSDTQYYDHIANKDRVYDQETQVIRPKSPGELGVCVTVPQPNCQAITVPRGEEDGNATWPVAEEVGQSVKGTCIKGFSVADEKQLTRTCIMDREKGAVFTKPNAICQKINPVQITESGLPYTVQDLGGNKSQYHGFASLRGQQFKTIKLVINNVSLIKTMHLSYRGGTLNFNNLSVEGDITPYILQGENIIYMTHVPPVDMMNKNFDLTLDIDWSYIDP